MSSGKEHMISGESRGIMVSRTLAGPGGSFLIVITVWRTSR